MSSNPDNENNTVHDDDIKMGLTKKQRSWVYTGIFFIVVIILFIVNNTNGVAEQGPYPPHYQESQAQTLSLSDLKGKVVILDFWATWCAPCRKGVPDLVELKEKYKDKDFEVVGISLDAITRGGSTTNDVEPFMEAYKINYPIVKGNEKAVYEFGNITTIPTTFILDRNGRIVEKYEQLVPKETYIKVINEVLTDSYNSEINSIAPDFSLTIIGKSG